MSTKEKKEKTKTKTSLALQPHKPKKKKMIWPSSVQWCVRWHFKYWRLIFCASIAQVKSVREVKMLTRRYSIDRMISFHASETERRAQVASTKSRRIYKSNLSKLEINRKKKRDRNWRRRRWDNSEEAKSNWNQWKELNENEKKERAASERRASDHRASLPTNHLFRFHLAFCISILLCFVRIAWILHEFWSRNNRTPFVGVAWTKQITDTNRARKVHAASDVLRVPGAMRI